MTIRTLRPAAAVFGAALAMTSQARADPAQYVLDPDHLTIGILVEHIGYQKVLGLFREGEGSFVFDEAARTVSDLEVTIAADSFFTDHEDRDRHVRSPDFLNAREFPDITFVGRTYTATGERTGTIVGDLTVLGTTRPVTLEVTWNKSGEYPYPIRGKFNYVTGISARTSFNRSDFGMTYGIDNGLVGNRVEVIIEAEGIRQ